LGPGLLESSYEGALAAELAQRGLTVSRQAKIEAHYRGVSLGVSYRADLVVEGCVLVEVKSVKNIAKVHKQQLLTYLRHSGLRLGLLLNFGRPRMREGIIRIANNLPED